MANVDIVITWGHRPEGFEDAPTERMIAVAEPAAEITAGAATADQERAASDREGG